MAMIHKFCFWFSVRLGTIIVGIGSLIQSSIWFMISIICLDNLKEVKASLHALTENLSIRNKFFKHLTAEPQTYLVILTVFFSLLLVSSVLLIVGAFKCQFRYMIPFVIIDVVYVIFLLVHHVLLMLNVKELDADLGSLILYSNVGGFAILFLLYMLACVVSFIQILRQLESQVRNQKPLFGYETVQKPLASSLLTLYDEKF